jgi:glycosyltransferase involved in cell wall biosynthesis
MKLNIYIPKKNGGVYVVMSNLADSFESKGILVTRSYSIWNMIKSSFISKSTYYLLSTHSFILFFLFSRKSVFILHGFPVFGAHSFFQRFFLRYLPHLNYLFGGKNIAVSYLTRAIYEKIFNVPVHECIHNGIDNYYNNFQLSRSKPRNNIVYVGRLDENKGIQRIIDAFQSISDTSYKLILIGDGPLKKPLLKLNSERIVVLGFLSEDEKVKYLSEADIFISLNDFEPMGITFLEAAVLQCKIVAPFAGGFHEFVDRNVPLFLCDQKSTPSVAEALTKAINFSYKRVSLPTQTPTYDNLVVNKYISFLRNS